MRAFEEALHALKHIKSFQGNQLWRKEQCESFSKLELQIQNFQVERMNCYKPTVVSVPTTWAFRWALESRTPTSSVWGRRLEGLENFFLIFKLHANQLQLETMEEDITASLKILNTVCFEWTLNILNPKENYSQQSQREASTNDASIKSSIFQAQA